MLEKKNKELKQNEERVKSANLELCTKMREMIQELDQEKQETAHRWSTVRAAEMNLNPARIVSCRIIIFFMQSGANSSTVQGRCGEPSQNRAHAGTWCSDWRVVWSTPAAGPAVTVSSWFYLHLNNYLCFPQYATLCPPICPLRWTKFSQSVFLCRTQLFDVNDKLLAVQECYISVCKEKDMLLEKIDGKEKEEDLIRENEVGIFMKKSWWYLLGWLFYFYYGSLLTFLQLKMKVKMDTALENLRAELEAQHQASTNQLKALWSKQKEAEVKQQVNSQVASVKAACQEEVQQVGFT